MLHACSQKFKQDGLDSGRRGSVPTMSTVASWEAKSISPQQEKQGHVIEGREGLGCRFFFSCHSLGYVILSKSLTLSGPFSSVLNEEVGLGD